MKDSKAPVPPAPVIAEDLQKAFDADQDRRIVGRIRELFDDIEKKIEGGMSLKNIQAVLEKNNLKVKLGTLTRTLGRIRKERAAKAALMVMVPAQPSVGETPSKQVRKRKVATQGSKPVQHNRRSTDPKSEGNSSNATASVEGSTVKLAITSMDLQDIMRDTSEDAADYE